MFHNGTNILIAKIICNKRKIYNEKNMHIARMISTSTYIRNGSWKTC